MRKPDYRRLTTILRREGEPDKVPFYEHFVDKEVMETILGEEMPAINQNLNPKLKRKHVAALIKFYRKMGYDYVPLEIPLNLPRTNRLRARDTAPLSRGVREWQDENRGEIETMEEFEAYPWPDLDDAADLTYFDMLERLLPEDMGIVGGVAGGVFEHVSWLMGLVPLCKALYTDRLLVEKMFERVGSIIVKVDEKILRTNKLIALRMGDDMGYKKGTFLSPDILRKYVFPWQKKCADAAHRRGLPFILHSCGNLKNIMDDLIGYVGIDAKHSFQDEIEPVWEAKNNYGDRMAILGGVDVDKLSRLQIKPLRTYIRQILEKCSPGGGYALGSGNTITNYTPIENYLAMLDEGEKFPC
ncbi:uroporphyrinogen-III decarboxylase-like protein [Candidatus Bathyarchaeota archaeon]|nr:uroporphyrinogen-III decarboxylase-like protein [Candidatus Bathyarchaeota archaeon]